ncbi:integrase core domain-containing protein, partial [Xanthomonas euvesicatoria]
GTPTDNAMVESFNGRLRQECLNAHWFLSLADARSKIEAWRRFYNEERPHSALAWNPCGIRPRTRVPSEFNEGACRLKHETATCRPWSVGATNSCLLHRCSVAREAEASVEPSIG